MTQKPYYDPKTGIFTLHINGATVTATNQDDLDDILDYADHLQRVRDRRTVKATRQASRLFPRRSGGDNN